MFPGGTRRTLSHPSHPATRDAGPPTAGAGPPYPGVVPPAHPTPTVLALVALGGGTGASARWCLDTWAPAEAGTFPWTTFCINVVGCLLLALLPASDAVRRSRLLPPALGTGLLGGFTTLSAVSDQSRALLADDHVALAATYSGATLLACLLVVALADRLSTAAQRAEFDEEEGDL